MYHCYYNTGQAGMKGAKGEAGVTGPAGHPGATSGYGKQSAPGKCLCYLGSITALLFTINFKTTCHTHIKSLYLSLKYLSFVTVLTKFCYAHLMYLQPTFIQSK